MYEQILDPLVSLGSIFPRIPSKAYLLEKLEKERKLKECFQVSTLPVMVLSLSGSLEE